MSCTGCQGKNIFARTAKKASSIVAGYSNLIAKNPVTEQLANERLAVCALCKDRKTFGLLSIDYCGRCICPLAAKTRSKEESCEYWKD